MIVATAGHIDHGKTTLIRALTGVDTDRLPEEKKRGISIDLGFAYWPVSEQALTIGFVDVPGHERFVRNMVAGICGIDCALFVVAADDGLMPQSIEHLQILKLMGVQHGVAVITKCDRVDAARIEHLTSAIRQTLAHTQFAHIPILAISAQTGLGMPALREHLIHAGKHAHRLGDPSQQHARFAIDRVFTSSGSGTIATGTVFAGAIQVGDKLLLSPSGLDVRVRGLQKNAQSTQRVERGERCAINLSGVRHTQLQRGDWIVHPDLHAPTQRIDVHVEVLATETQSLSHWTPVHIHHGAQHLSGRIAMRRGGRIAPGQRGMAQLLLHAPAAALHGDRFILRDQSARRTIGGGSVLDPAVAARPAHRHLREQQRQALHESDVTTAFAALLQCSPDGIDHAWFARIFNLNPAAMDRLLSQHAVRCLGKAPIKIFSSAKIADIQAKLLRALENFHQQQPRASGEEIATLHAKLAPEISATSFLELLQTQLTAGVIEHQGSQIKLSTHRSTDNTADEKLWARIQPPLQAAGFNGLTISELAASARIKQQLLTDFLHRKTKTGALIRVTEDRFYLRATMAEFIAIVQTTAQHSAEGKFVAAQVRDRTDIGRTRVIQILECFDRLGLTRRQGDLRTLRSNAPPILDLSNHSPQTH